MPGRAVPWAAVPYLVHENRPSDSRDVVKLASACAPQQSVPCKSIGSRVHVKSMGSCAKIVWFWFSQRIRNARQILHKFHILSWVSFAWPVHPQEGVKHFAFFKNHLAVLIAKTTFLSAKTHLAFFVWDFLRISFRFLDRNNIDHISPNIRSRAFDPDLGLRSPKREKTTFFA